MPEKDKNTPAFSEKIVGIVSVSAYLFLQKQRLSSLFSRKLSPFLRIFRQEMAPQTGKTVLFLKKTCYRKSCFSDKKFQTKYINNLNNR